MRYEELKENYAIIRRLRIMQDLLMYESLHRRLIGYIKEQLRTPQDLENVFLKGKEAKTMPFAVEFHLAHGCNAKCLGCPNIDSDRAFVKYDQLGEPLDIKKVKMLIDAFLEQGVERFVFAGGGEPMISPMLIPAIEYARSRSSSVNIALYTNGIGLTKLSKIEQAVLVKSLNRIRVSMDASNADDWAFYKGLDAKLFQQIWIALSNLKTLRDQLGTEVKLGAGCLVSSSCEDRKIMDFIDIASQLGLDFCDIKYLFESDGTKSAYRASSSNFIEIVDEIMQAKETKKYGDMHIGLDDNFVIDWYASKMGLENYDIVAARRCWMARVGRKVTIGPYGGIYPCSDAANPGVLKVLNAEPRMAVITNFENEQVIQDQFSAFWQRSRSKRDSFDPPTHNYCVPSNSGFNNAVEKLWQDWDYGIALSEQPISPNGDDYLKARGFAVSEPIKPESKAEIIQRPEHVSLSQREQLLSSRLKSFMEKGDFPYNYEKLLLLNHFPVVKRVVRGEVVEPFEFEIHPTSRCNLRCRHCIGIGKKPSEVSELSEQQLMHLIRDIYDWGEQESSNASAVKRIRFSGITGEPLLNPGTIPAIKSSIQHGFEVGLVTNGTLLTESLIETLTEATYVHISLDAASTDTYMKMKGGDRTTFEAVISSIERLVALKKTKRSKLQITLGFVLLPQNYHELPDFIRMAKRLGVNFVRVRAPEGIATDTITNPQWQKIYANLRRLKHLEDDDFNIVFTDETKSGTIKPDFYTCPAHAFLTVIGPKGSVFPCCHVCHITNLHLGNAVQENISTIWQGKNKRVVLDRLNPAKMCPTCPPRAFRINKFILFLQEEYNRNPAFLSWLEAWTEGYSSNRKTLTPNTYAAIDSAA